MISRTHTQTKTNWAVFFGHNLNDTRRESVLMEGRMDEQFF